VNESNAYRAIATSESEQVNQVMSYQREQQLKRERGALPLDTEPEDPGGWPYGEEAGPPYPDPAAEPRQQESASDITLAAFTIAPREHLCPECWCIHRPELDCS
jgi:hypothetical protein